MKKITLLSIALVSIYGANAQDNKKESDSASSTFNKWTIEATVGQSKGVKPYAVGYYSSDAGTFLGKPQANSFALAARYMFSPAFGIKGGLHYDDLKNTKNNGSKPFQMQQIGLSVQGVVNANRLFKMEDALGRFGLLLHGGVRIDRMTSRTADEFFPQDHNEDISEYNGGLILGVTPQFRVAKRISLLLDITIQNSYRQHFNWDGSYSDNINNLNGQLITTSLGLTYSFGDNDMHGDWQKIEDPKSAEIAALTNRVGEVETLMNDTDKDGVPDYLDQENNSVAGVAVDSRGKMVDMNKNGVPDELERYLSNNYSTKEAATAANTNLVLKLINDGYVSTYFDFGKIQPTNVSTEGIDFIRTYLKNNPSASIDIYGHADEIGSSERNTTLSKDRAEAVKAILVKSGIEASRLNVVPVGEDASVEKDSDGARKLVRRVTFKVKE